MTTAGIRVGSLSVDGTPISTTDLARIEAEDKLHEQMQVQTVRVIASASKDAVDCRMLLDMLGIDNTSVLAARGPAAGSKEKSGRRGRRVAAA